MSDEQDEQVEETEQAEKAEPVEQAPVRTPDPESESWEIAKRIAQKTGKVSSLFSSCIRAANKVESVVSDADEKEIRAFAAYTSNFLLKISPSLRSVFYFVAKTHHPEAIRAIQKFNVTEMMGIFSPAELASVLGITFLYRKMRKACNQEEWKLLRKKILAHIDIGTSIGKRMQHIGVGNGILIGGLRFLAITAFANYNFKAYQEYKKKSRRPNCIFDMKIETEVFGCNHLQVASYLATELGYVAPRSTVSLTFGMDAFHVDPKALSPKLQEQVISWRGAMAYIESYHATGEAPDVSKEYLLTLTTDQRAMMEREIELILNQKDGPAEHWLEKGWNDLPPEIAAALSPNGEKVEETAEQQEAPSEEEVTT